MLTNKSSAMLVQMKLIEIKCPMFQLPAKLEVMPADGDYARDISEILGIGKLFNKYFTFSI